MNGKVKILITGANGYIGNCLYHHLNKKFRIVGPDEIYDRKDYISIDSPMARALIKKQVDDDFEVPTPQGKKQWYVNSIDYQKKK